MSTAPSLLLVNRSCAALDTESEGNVFLVKKLRPVKLKALVKTSCLFPKSPQKDCCKPLRFPSLVSFALLFDAFISQLHQSHIRVHGDTEPPRLSFFCHNNQILLRRKQCRIECQRATSRQFSVHTRCSTILASFLRVYLNSSLMTKGPTTNGLKRNCIQGSTQRLVIRAKAQFNIRGWNHQQTLTERNVP